MCYVLTTFDIKVSPYEATYGLSSNYCTVAKKQMSANCQLTKSDLSFNAVKKRLMTITNILFLNNLFVKM